MRRMIVCLLGCLMLTACTVGIVGVEDNTSTPSSKPTLSPTPTVAPTPLATPTEAPTPMPTTTMPPPTATPRPSPVLPTHTPNPTSTPALAIQSFTVDIEDIATGKRLTFTWKTSGASKVIIFSGTAQRFQPSWEVPPSGTLTVELAHTLFPNPAVTLVARDGHGNQVTESVTIEWPCQYEYFLTAAPTDCPGLATCYCPLYEATFSAAAEQPFENGRMIWLQEMRVKESVIENKIFVLYDDGRGEHFDDTWTPDEPESDPQWTPPAGRYQPIRGFGKLWRENASVRERLGWGLAPEQGFEGVWQQQINESLPGVVYIRTIDIQVIKFSGWGMGSGSWQLVAP